jgi:hypothetical protein
MLEARRGWRTLQRCGFAPLLLAGSPARRLPRATKLYRVTAPIWLLVLMLTACGREPAPEQQVRATIAAGEEAAEQRDAVALLDLISDRYADSLGRSSDDLGQYVRGYLLLHPSIHLVTRVESVEFPFRDQAHVRLTIGSLAREKAGVPLDVAADLQTVDLELTREGDDWRVTRAERVD